MYRNTIRYTLEKCLHLSKVNNFAYTPPSCFFSSRLTKRKSELKSSETKEPLTSGKDSKTQSRVFTGEVSHTTLWTLDVSPLKQY